MTARFASLLVLTAVAMVLMISRWNASASAPRETAGALSSLGRENSELRRHIEAFEQQAGRKLPGVPLSGVGASVVAPSSASAPSGGAASAATSNAAAAAPPATAAAAAAVPAKVAKVADAADAASMLALHGNWDWHAIARELLEPFTSIDLPMLEAAVAKCNNNATMYCLRAQVKGGSLYITDYRAIFFDRHYAPARVMPLLDVLRRHRDMPDLDIVVAAVDEPRVKAKVNQYEWSKLVSDYPGTPGAPAPWERGGGAKLPPPLFSSTVDRSHFDLAWPDFSFFMPRRPHKLRTPPWVRLHPQMLAESEELVWAEKIELAVHTGNVGSSHRKKLAATARANPKEMLVSCLLH